MEDQDARSIWLGHTELRLAFNDALGVSNSAVEGMGDEELRPSACKLVDSVRQNTSIDRPLQ